MINLLLALALSAHAATPKAAPKPAVRPDPRLLTPVTAGGSAVNYRLVRLDVPADSSAQIVVSLAKDGDACFDTSIIDWNKSLVNGKRYHSLNFDATRSQRGEGCPRRKAGQLGLHTVTLPPEKGGMHVVITYREGTEVTALIEK